MFLKNQRLTQYQKCNSTFIIYANEEYLLQEILQGNKGEEFLAAAGKRG